MPSLDDIPTLPPCTPTGDDLIAVIDGSDRRSPKRCSLSQLATAGLAVSGDGTGITDAGAFRASLEIAQPVLNVLDFGAVGDGKATMVAAMTSGSAVLTSADAGFVAGDVGKWIRVEKAGAAGADLVTTIASRASGTQITLSVAASTTVTPTGVFWGTNDTAAVQAAIDEAASSTTCRTVFFPQGRFICNVTVGSNVHLRGLGGGLASFIIAGSNNSLVTGSGGSPTVLYPATRSEPVIAFSTCFGSSVSNLKVSGSDTTAGGRVGIGIEVGASEAAASGYTGNSFDISFVHVVGFDYGITHSRTASTTISNTGVGYCNYGFFFSETGVSTGITDNVAVTSCFSHWVDTVFFIDASKNITLNCGDYNYPVVFADVRNNGMLTATGINVEMGGILASTLSAAASDNSINDSANGFLASYLRPGQQVKISGFTGNTVNNLSIATIQSITAGKIVIASPAGDSLVDDAAGESVSIYPYDPTIKLTTGGSCNIMSIQMLGGSASTIIRRASADPGTCALHRSNAASYYETAGSEYPTLMPVGAVIRRFSDYNFGTRQTIEAFDPIRFSIVHSDRLGLLSLEESWRRGRGASPYGQLGWTVGAISGGGSYSVRGSTSATGVEFVSSSTDAANAARLTLEAGLLLFTQSFEFSIVFGISGPANSYFRLGLYSRDATVDMEPDHGIGLRLDRRTPDANVFLEFRNGGTVTSVDTGVVHTAISTSVEARFVRTSTGYAVTLRNATSRAILGSQVHLACSPASQFVSPAVFSAVATTGWGQINLGDIKVRQVPTNTLVWTNP